MDLIRNLVFIYMINACLDFSHQTEYVKHNLEDAIPSFNELAAKYGKHAEEYNVTTKDGYILKLFHIPGDKNRTVLLMHGVVDTADTFIIRGNNSLAITLAEAGYDVWAGNPRGDKYSRDHLTLSTSNPEFWDFSFHEMGIYDLPAIIDFILSVNKVDKISAIGHSQGNTIFYVLASYLPEYNDKIKGLIALGPVSTLNHLKYPTRLLIKLAPLMNSIFKALKQEELFGENSLLRRIAYNVCANRKIGYVVCANIFFIIGGRDPEEFEPKFLPVVAAHYPNSVARKNLDHVAQIAIRGIFSPYDYGVEKNYEIYNSSYPPAYDLRRVTMKVALFAARNDGLAPLEDVETLIKQLPNAEYHIMERKQANHMDFVWGKNMKNHLFPHVFRVLEAFNKNG